MKVIRSIALLLTSMFIFSSCQSVYINPDPPENTTPPGIDIDSEYFTTGNVYEYDMWLPEDGRYYRGSWYYTETRKYKAKDTNIIDDSTIYSSVYITRIVKYNAATNTVSSACLQPTCNHSPESDCLMVHIDGIDSKIFIERIVGDWMLIKKYNRSDMIGILYELIAYNLNTGESTVIYSDGYNEKKITDWAGGTAYGNKLYMTLHYLDYSETDFDIDGNVPLSNYKPQTVSYAYEYDLETQKQTELFELPSGYNIKAFSNKRLLVISDTEEFYTCNFDGSNMQKADVLDFSPRNMIGTFAYSYLDDGFKLYNLRTNTQKTVKIDNFALYQDCIITDGGIIYNTFTTIEEWNSMIAGRKDYIKVHGASSVNQYESMCDAVKYKGTAQLWRSDHEGNNLELIFEKENAVIRYLFGDERYIYGYVTFGDPKSYAELPYENEGRCAINLETGEIVSIPYLDVALTEGYDLIDEEEQ